MTKKKVKTKGSAVSDHLFRCNHSLFFENFSVLTKQNKRFLLELKESLLIMRNKPSLNRNIYLHRYTYSTKYRFTPLLESLILGSYWSNFNCYVIDFYWKKCKGVWMNWNWISTISEDTTITLYCVMTLVLTRFFSYFFIQHMIILISSRVLLYCIVIDQINYLKMVWSLSTKRRLITSIHGLVEKN